MTGAEPNKYKRPDGYIYIHMPGHPKAKSNKYVLEHIVIMENYLGRDIIYGECVHHKNQIKDDNRVENLEVMSRADHVRLHHKGKSKEKCKFPGCDNEIEGLGLCNKHYIGYRRNYKKYRDVFSTMEV